MWLSQALAHFKYCKKEDYYFMMWDTCPNEKVYDILFREPIKWGNWNTQEGVWVIALSKHHPTPSTA